MAFTAKILSWRFRHLNIVGCLLNRRPTKGGGGGGGGGGGSRAPQDPPLATPLQHLAFLVLWSCSVHGSCFKSQRVILKNAYLATNQV